jgi:hypothetical protein
VGTKQTAEWFSPGAANISLPIADLFALRALCSREGADFNALKNAWPSICSQITHKVVLSFAEEEWYFAVDYFAESSAVLWPADRQQVPGSPNSYFFEPRLNVGVPVLRPIVDLKMQACSVEVVSWLTQCLRFPKVVGTLQPAIRTLQKGHQTTLVKVASSNAFWSLGKTTLLQIAKSEGIAIPAGASLVDTLFKMVVSISEVSEEAAIPIVAQRQAVSDISSNFHSALMEVDEAVQCLDQRDHDEFKKEEKMQLRRSRKPPTSSWSFVDELERFERLFSPRPSPKLKARPRQRQLRSSRIFRQCSPRRRQRRSCLQALRFGGQ